MAQRMATRLTMAFSLFLLTPAALAQTGSYASDPAFAERTGVGEADLMPLDTPAPSANAPAVTPANNYAESYSESSSANNNAVINTGSYSGVGTGNYVDIPPLAAMPATMPTEMPQTQMPVTGTALDIPLQMPAPAPAMVRDGNFTFRR